MDNSTLKEIERAEEHCEAAKRSTAAPVQAAVEPTAPASEVVQPVAFCNLEMWASGKFWPDDCFSREQTEGTLPLYTAPAVSLAGLEEVERALASARKLLELCGQALDLSDYISNELRVADAALTTINSLIEAAKKG